MKCCCIISLTVRSNQLVRTEKVQQYTANVILFRMSSTASGYKLNQQQRPGLKRVAEDNDCQSLAAESYKCLANKPGRKQNCNRFFKAYKECKKRQTEERKSRNLKATGGNEAGMLASMKDDVFEVLSFFGISKGENGKQD